MRKNLFALLFLLLAWFLTPAAAPAQSLITATITITNTSGTTNGQTITVNGDTRTWTTSVVFPLTQILTNNNIGGCATNLFNAAAAAPFANLSLAQLTNGITLQTAPNGGMTVSLSPGWGSVTLSTNLLVTAFVVRMPISVETAANQTNIATYLAQALESALYGISTGAPVLSNMVNIAGNQTITGSKVFNAGLWKGSVGALSIYGTVLGLTNGVWTNATLLNSFAGNLTQTNGTNYGLAFSSPGTNATSEEFGAGAVAASAQATALGYLSYAQGLGSSALGYQSAANGIQSLSLGPNSTSFGNWAVALGFRANAQGTNSIAIGVNSFVNDINCIAIGEVSEADQYNGAAFGYNSWAKYTNSTAIGHDATTTTTNQVMLGTSSDTVMVPGKITISGSVGQNNLSAGSDLAFNRFALSSIANGNNAGVIVGTNVFAEISGPSGAFTINGIAGGRDGKVIILLNRTGQSMTIANDSGVEPVSANRIYTARGTDSTIAGSCSATLIYDAAVSHWVLLFLTQ